MAYTTSVVFKLAPSSTGLTGMKVQPVDTTGSNVGAAITTGFVELGTGEYLWTGSLPTNHRGAIKLLSSADAFITAMSVNAQELENPDTKTSTVSGSGGTTINEEINLTESTIEVID